MRATCPCCGSLVPLVRDGVLLSHPRSSVQVGPGRAGSYCEGTGYTPDQARRWGALDAATRARLTRFPAGVLNPPVEVRP